MTYDPNSYTGVGTLPTLYTRTANGAINQWTVWARDGKVHVEWGQVGGQMQYAAFDCEAKNIGRANSTTFGEQAIKEAIAKWKKQLKKKYFMSEADAETSLNLKPMLAHEFKKRLEKGAVTFPVDVQPKYDGVRCLTYRKGGALMMQSRGGDPYVVHHLRVALEPVVNGSMVLDGELYIHGMSLQNITSLVKRPREESAQLTYCIYDITDLNDQSAPWSQRLQSLLAFFGSYPFITNAGIHMTWHCIAGTPEQVQMAHDQYVQQGYEGAIIRQHHGLYRFGYRSHELLKLKSFQDAEFRIIGWTRGKGKFEDYPVFKCITAEGKDFDCLPKGTDQERREMLANANSYIGKDLNVRFFQWTDERKPQFPIGMYIREKGT